MKIIKLFVFVFALTFCFFACKKPQKTEMPPAPVNAVKAIKADLPYNVSYPAAVAGSLEVMVNAQVSGILKAKLYDEGAYVEAGAQLFQIDDALYKAALEKAKGDLAAARAAYNNAKVNYERMSYLNKKGAISKQDYTTAKTNYASAKANVAIAKAEVDTASVNLGYTKVTAPISGIASIAKVDVGNLIASQGVNLTNMVQIDPLFINFSMPATAFAELSKGFDSGVVDGENIAVEIMLPNGEPLGEQAKIIFVDSTQDVQTSSIQMRAALPNPRESVSGVMLGSYPSPPRNKFPLMPGTFVRVRLSGINYKNQIVVPDTAVLKTPAGDVAYAVNAQNTLEARKLTGRTLDSFYLVYSGLAEGETVVDGGLIKVKAGQKVTPAVKEFSVNTGGG